VVVVMQQVMLAAVASVAWHLEPLSQRHMGAAAAAANWHPLQQQQQQVVVLGVPWTLACLICQRLGTLVGLVVLALMVMIGTQLQNISSSSNSNSSSRPMQRLQQHSQLLPPQHWTLACWTCQHLVDLVLAVVLVMVTTGTHQQ
jgi:predicted dinucleotide-binding enzyme